MGNSDHYFEIILTNIHNSLITLGQDINRLVEAVIKSDISKANEHSKLMELSSDIKTSLRFMEKSIATQHSVLIENLKELSSKITDFKHAFDCVNVNYGEHFDKINKLIINTEKEMNKLNTIIGAAYSIYHQLEVNKKSIDGMDLVNTLEATNNLRDFLKGDAKDIVEMAKTVLSIKRFWQDKWKSVVGAFGIITIAIGVIKYWENILNFFKRLAGG